MANIKSAKKRISVNEKKRAQNNAAKSEIKTFIKKFRAAITAKELDLASELLNTVFGLLDSAAGNGTIHKNKANRHKGKLAKMLDENKVAKVA